MFCRLIMFNIKHCNLCLTFSYMNGHRLIHNNFHSNCYAFCNLSHICLSTFSNYLSSACRLNTRISIEKWIESCINYPFPLIQVRARILLHFEVFKIWVSVFTGFLIICASNFFRFEFILFQNSYVFSLFNVYHASTFFLEAFWDR